MRLSTPSADATSTPGPYGGVRDVDRSQQQAYTHALFIELDIFTGHLTYVQITLRSGYHLAGSECSSDTDDDTHSYPPAQEESINLFIIILPSHRGRGIKRRLHQR